MIMTIPSLRTRVTIMALTMMLIIAKRYRNDSESTVNKALSQSQNSGEIGYMKSSLQEDEFLISSEAL